VRRVILARPRGFCAGVEMAIKALSWMTRIFEPPIYCYHEIVHNSHVVEQFIREGVIFVDDVTEVPPGAPLMLSAHGSPPAVVAEAGKRSSFLVNAVCPLVTKVHHEVKVRASKGYQIIYVGHAGHEEAVGTMAEAPDAIQLVETPADLDAIGPISGPVAVLTQTTLSRDDWSEIHEQARSRFAGAWVPGRSDLCYATTNRQAALAAVAGQADAVVVIGSVNSSNTIALTKVAAATGCPLVVRVDSAAELPEELTAPGAEIGTVGITAGASAPESLLREVLDALHPTEGVEEITMFEEDEYFPPPPELRELMPALAAVLAMGLLAPPPTASPLSGDRSARASDVLEDIGQAGQTHLRRPA